MKTLLLILAVIFLASIAGGAEAAAADELTTKVIVLSGRGTIMSSDGRGEPVILTSGQMSLGLAKPQPVGVKDRRSIEEFTEFVKFTSKENNPIKRVWQGVWQRGMELAGRDYYGTLSVSSNPSGGRVYIDDYPIGDAPLAIREEPRRHLVVVNLSEYPLSRELVQVKRGKTTFHRADLVPPAPGVSIRPTTVKGKLVTRIAVVEGKVTLKKPTAAGDLEELIVVGANQSTELVEEVVLDVNQSGDQMLSIAKVEIISEQPVVPLKIATLDESDRQVIEAAATDIQKVVAEVEEDKNYGQLSVASIPVGGQVSLNGESRGRAPLLLRVEEGVYQVVVQVSGLPDWTQEVEVVVDQETFVEARFIDTEAPIITLRPTGEAVAGETISVEAGIQDNLGVHTATLFYRTGRAGGFLRASMAAVGRNLYRGDIPADAVRAPGINFYVEASDGSNRAAAPGDSTSPGFIAAIEPVGDIRVESDPPGAAVTLDGEPKGLTPVTMIGIVAGLHSLSLSLDGYRPWNGEVVVERGGEARSALTLEPLAGTIIVDSSPAGASVYLDEDPRATTPAEIDQVAVGDHVLKLSLDGYRDWSDQITIEPGGRVSRQVSLDPMVGWVSVNSQPSGVTTILDGKPIGPTPLERVELRVGDHQLTLRLERFAAVEETFTIEDDAETALDYALQQTSFMVDINSAPSEARVYLDDRLRGATPIERLDLALGDYAIRIEKNDRYVPFEGRLVVQAGEEEPIPFNFDLTPLFGTIVVRTEPDAALVYMGDRLIGGTPVEFRDAAVGEHDIRIEKDKYEPISTRTVIVGDETTSLDLVLEPKPGFLDIRSAPAAATVYLGDQHLGETPLTGVELNPGDYTVRITKPKFEEISLPAHIASDKTTALIANLTPLSGYLSVLSSPEGAEVALDGEILGVTPLIQVELKTGSYRLSLRVEDYGGAEVTVAVESAETSTADLTLEYLFGGLKVSSEPEGAKVLLNGSRVGNTPLTLDKVGIGEYDIKLSLEDYQDHNGQVVIESDGDAEYTAALKIKLGEIALISDPSDALVYLNGNYIGNAPISLTDLGPGDYELALTHTGYEVWERKSLRVSPGRTTNLRAELAKHILYQEVSILGVDGPQEGRLMLPLAIATGIDGRIYVADAGSHRVIAYNADGGFLFKIGGDGSQADERTTDIGGEITADGSGGGDGQFNLPRGLAIDGDGNLYVSDSLNNRIQKFDRDGTFLLKFGKGGTEPEEFNKPAGIAIDPGGNIWVVDSENHRVEKYSADGEYLSSLGEVGVGAGQFNNPEGLGIDSSGNVYVVDWGNSRMQKFSPEGNFLLSFGEAGSDKGQFAFPSSATIDASNDLYVTDSDNNRIQRFDDEGNFRMYIQPLDEAVESFSRPQGLSVNEEGVLTVVEKDAARVRILRPVWDQEFIPKI